MEYVTAMRYSVIRHDTAVYRIVMRSAVVPYKKNKAYERIQKPADSHFHFSATRKIEFYLEEDVIY